MPIRSIKLKLEIPRNAKEKQGRQDLWTTHQTINQAVNYYEEMLLTLRGHSYTVSECEEVTEEEVHAKLEVLINDARRRNNMTGAWTSEANAKAKQQLLELYAMIVPPAIGGKGKGIAKRSPAYLGPLTDSKSQGFLSAIKQTENPPQWLEDARDGELNAFKKAQDWLTSSEGIERCKNSGRPPAWLKLAREKNNAWISAYVKDFDRKLIKKQGVANIISQLKKSGVLPIFPAFLAPKISTCKNKLSQWDRLAFQLAVAHLLSWESCCRDAANNHRELHERLKASHQKHFAGPEVMTGMSILQRYERERTSDLASASAGLCGTFRIKPRMIGGWRDLRIKWQEAEDKSEGRLKAIFYEEQDRLRRKSGDSHLFCWLARPENHSVWLGEGNLLKLYAKYNDLLFRAERSKGTAFLTLADPIRHPQSTHWVAEGGSNFRNYRFSFVDNQLRVTLPLLSQNTEKLQDVKHSYSVAYSKQFQQPVLKKDGNLTYVTYKCSSGENFSGKLMGADLLFDYYCLCQRPLAFVKEGNVGSVFLKISLGIDTKAPNGSTENRPDGMFYFLSARGTNWRGGKIVPGLRILSVDLGMHTFATCSVFELSDTPPVGGKLHFPLETENLWAIHERSFSMYLPGEKVDRNVIAWRKQQRKDLWDLRHSLNRYHKLFLLDKLVDNAERMAWIEDYKKNVDVHALPPFEKEILEDVLINMNLKAEQWELFSHSQRTLFRRGYGKQLKKWLKRKFKIPKNGQGKTLWAVGYFLDKYRLLKSWSHNGHKYGHRVRGNREKRGIFCYWRLKHIRGLKVDRSKTGADLIVQAARGFLRDDKGRWQKEYEPCQVVLLEKLSNYRTKNTRSRQDNEKLVQWSHCAILRELKIQTEIYRIHTVETEASYSSQYYAKTHAPGIRCHRLSVANLKDEFFLKSLKKENPSLDISSLSPGDCVPRAGGEVFVTLNRGNVIKLDADINAAQSLQRRFWTRHDQAFCLPCRKVVLNGDEHWVPVWLGKRLFGSLGGTGFLVKSEQSTDSFRWESINLKQYMDLGGKLVEEQNIEDAGHSDDSSEEMPKMTGDVVVFFRDPSGEILPSELWYPSQSFWETVKKKIAEELNIQS